MSEQPTLIRTLNRKSLAPSDAYGVLVPWPIEHLLFLMAKVQLKSTTQRAMQRIREYLTTWQHCSIILTGHDLEALGLIKGPAYGRILEAIF